jgi:hypothetical protein
MSRLAVMVAAIAGSAMMATAAMEAYRSWSKKHKQGSSEGDKDDEPPPGPPKQLAAPASKHRDTANKASDSKSSSADVFAPILPAVELVLGNARRVLR